MSSRRVARGEELLLSYGLECWLPGFAPSTQGSEAVKAAVAEYDRLFEARSAAALSTMQTRYAAELDQLSSILKLDGGLKQ